jgi:hypothetical protein
MGHVIHIESDEQYVDAIRVLNKLPGMWHGRGTPEAPVLLVLESHYDALVKAGVVCPNGKEGKTRGKKTDRKKNKS